MDRDSYERNGDGYLLTTETMRWFWNHYCPEDARTQPDVAPLRAASHADLPPAIVVTAEFDPLCDEGAAYVSALADAGSSAELMAFDGLVHDFFATARLFACSREAVNAVYARLNALLG